MVPLTESASAPSRTAPAKRWTRHRLAEQVRRALPGERVCQCGQRAIPGQAPRLVDSGTSSHLAGVRSCGSLWVCPYCAAKVGRSRVAELRRGLEAARTKGWHVYLVTFTVGHTKHDRLADLLEVLTNAMRRWRSGRAWVSFAEKHGYVGSVRNLEVTYGRETGWHPHSHAVLILEQPLGPVARSMLARRWRDAVRAWGGYASAEHGLRISGGPDEAHELDEYVLKEERRVREAEGPKAQRRWGEAEELVYAHVKLARGDRLTPWMLLRAAGELEDVDADPTPALAAFVEYARAFEGRRQLYWSRGLRDLLGLGDERSDQELAEAEGAGTVVHVFTFEEWRAVATYRAQPAVLEAYDEGGLPGLRDLLRILVNMRRARGPDQAAA